MPLYHPDENLLVEFVSGSLPIAQAVAIRAHLHFCTQCQQSVQRMEHVGAAMLDNLNPVALEESSFSNILSAIDGLQTPDVSPNNASNEKSVEAANNGDDVKDDELHELPKVVSTLLTRNQLKWHKVSRTLKNAPLTVGQKEFEVSLQRIKAGSSVPEHDHGGMEITVVLKGSFSDTQGIYQEGDFLVKQEGDIHQPISARNVDCLCLAVQESPVKLTGFLGKLMNPFIKLRAA